MLKLRTCMKAATNLSEEDAAAVVANYEANRELNMSVDDATAAAVNDALGAAEQDLAFYTDLAHEQYPETKPGDEVDQFFAAGRKQRRDSANENLRVDTTVMDEIQKRYNDFSYEHSNNKPKSAMVLPDGRLAIVFQRDNLDDGRAAILYTITPEAEYTGDTIDSLDGRRSRPAGYVITHKKQKFVMDKSIYVEEFTGELDLFGHDATLKDEADARAKAKEKGGETDKGLYFIDKNGKRQELRTYSMAELIEWGKQFGIKAISRVNVGKVTINGKGYDWNDAYDALAQKIHNASAKREAEDGGQQLDIEDVAGKPDNKSKTEEELRTKLSAMPADMLKKVLKGSSLKLAGTRQEKIQRLIDARQAIDTFKNYKSLTDVKAAIKAGEISAEDLFKWSTAISRGKAFNSIIGTEANAQSIAIWGTNAGAFKMQVTKTDAEVEADRIAAEAKVDKKFPVKDAITMKRKVRPEAEVSEFVPEWLMYEVEYALDAMQGVLASHGYEYNKLLKSPGHNFPPRLSEPFRKIGDILAYTEVFNRSYKRVVKKYKDADAAKAAGAFMKLADSIGMSANRIHQIPEFHEQIVKHKGKVVKPLADTLTKDQKAEVADYIEHAKGLAEDYLKIGDLGFAQFFHRIADGQRTEEIMREAYDVKPGAYVNDIAGLKAYDIQLFKTAVQTHKENLAKVTKAVETASEGRLMSLLGKHNQSIEISKIIGAALGKIGSPTSKDMNARLITSYMLDEMHMHYSAAAMRDPGGFTVVGDYSPGKIKKTRARIVDAFKNDFLNTAKTTHKFRDSDFLKYYGLEVTSKTDEVKELPEGYGSGPSNRKNGNIDTVDPAIRDAVEETLGRLDPIEAARIRENMTTHVETPYAAALMKGLAIREMFHRALMGRDVTDIATSEIWGKQNLLNTKMVQTFMKGSEEVKRFAHTYAFMGQNRKAEHDVAGSFANCDPSKDCAKFCYSVSANTKPNELLKSEFTEFMAENYPEVVAESIYMDYSATAAGQRGLTLRVNDKGDLSKAQVKVINMLNEKEINGHPMVVQVFSKRPELLRLVNPQNWRSLSIDSTNFELAIDNPDLSLAVTITDGFTEDMLEQINDRVQVYLPVNLKGREVTKDDLRNMYPNLFPAMQKKVCPVDGSALATDKNISFVHVADGTGKGFWTCTSCNLFGAHGCFFSNSPMENERKAKQQQIVAFDADIGRGAQRDDVRQQQLDSINTLYETGVINEQQHKELLNSLPDGHSGKRTVPASPAEEGTDTQPGTSSSGEVESGTKTKQIVYKMADGTLPDDSVAEGKEQQIDMFESEESPGAVDAKKFRSKSFAKVSEVKVGTFYSGVEIVTKLEDAAHIMNPLRKYNVEQFMVLVLDENHRPISIIRSSIGTGDGASVYPRDVAGAIHATEGARYYYLAHNHPSGVIDPSNADNRITERIEGVLEATGVRMLGHIISGPSNPKQAMFDKTGRIDVTPTTAARNKLQIPVTEGRYTMNKPKGEGITSPKQGDAFINNMFTDDKGDLIEGIIFMDNRNRYTGFYPMTAEEMGSLRNDETDSGGAALIRAARQHGAMSSFMVIKNSDDKSVVKMKVFMDMLDVRLLDAFWKDGGQNVSAAERGILDDATEISYSKHSVKPSKMPPKGVTRDDAISAVDSFKAAHNGYPLGLEFVVYETKEQAFGAEKVATLKAEGTNTVKGGYYPRSGKVVLIAEDLNSVEDAVMTIRHEVLAHHGLNLFLKRDKEAILQRIMDSRSERSLKKIWTRIDKDYAGQSESIKAEEVLAAVAENKQGRLSKMWNDLVQLIRNALINKGWMTDKTTKGELQSLINSISDSISRGAQQQFYPSNDQNQYNADKQPMYYSAMQRFLADKLPNKGTGKSFNTAIQAYLNKGQFKAEELQWSGLTEWLEDQGKVTKSQVLDYLTANNLQVEEVMKGEEKNIYGDDTRLSDIERIKTFMREWGTFGVDDYTPEDEIGPGVYHYFEVADPVGTDEVYQLRFGDPGSDAYHFSEFKTELTNQYGNDFYTSLEDANRIMLDLARDYASSTFDSQTGPKYAKYTLGGGKDYRELLITMPAMTHDEAVERLKKLGYSLDRTYSMGGNDIYEVHPWGKDSDKKTPYEDLPPDAKRVLDQIRNRAEYSHPHWAEKNVLAHMRFNEHIDKDGKRVMFIEELQSDWHQAGRKRGYRESGDTIAKYQTMLEQLEAIPESDRTQAEWDQYHAAKDMVYGRKAGFVSNAPFKKTWEQLAIKRAIRYAAENGFDRVAWTPGSVQNERWDLSNWVSTVEYEKISGLYDIRAMSNAGMGEVEHSGLTEDALKEMVGTGVAQKIIDDAADRENVAKGWSTEFDEEEGGWVLYDYYGEPSYGFGGELRVRNTKEDAQMAIDELNSVGGAIDTGGVEIGGEGMRGFYDKMLPKIADKYIKKWGSKTKPIRIDTYGTAEYDDGRYLLDAENPSAPMDMMQRVNVLNANMDVVESFDNIMQAEEWLDSQTENIEVMGFDVTDKMRDAAMAGQPLFKTERDQVTESPNFKQWFADSKVTDDNGNPLVVYHGGVRAADIRVFDAMYGGQNTGNNEHGAFHFTDNSEVAEDYSRQAFIRTYQDQDVNNMYYDGYLEEEVNEFEDDIDVGAMVEEKADENISTSKVYLKMENPYIIDMKGETVDVQQIEELSQAFMAMGTGNYDNIPAEAFDALLELGYYDPDDIDFYRGDIEEKAMEEHGHDTIDEIEDWQFDAAADEFFGENGIERIYPEFDGLIIKNMIDDIGYMSKQVADQFIVFKPNQIKDATGKNVNFNEWHEDIMYRQERDTEGTGGQAGLPEETYTGKFIRLFQDGFNRIKTLQETIAERGGIVTPESDIYLAEERSSSIISVRLRQLDREHMKPLIQKMRDYDINLEMLDQYLMARHAQERNDYIASINPDMPDGGSGMTNEEARAILSDMRVRGLVDNMNELADHVYEVNKLNLDVLVAGGHMKYEESEALKEQYDYYIPLKGKEGIDNTRSLGAGFSVAGTGLKKAFGRGTGNLAESPVSHAFAQAESAIVRTEKTKVGHALVKLMLDNPDPQFWTLNRRTYDKFIGMNGEFIEGYAAPPTGLTENVDYHRVEVITAEEREAARLEGRDPRKQIVFRVDPRYRYRDEVFAVMIEGEEYLIDVKDPLVSEQLKRMNTSQLNFVTATAGTVNRYLAMINTALNPEFVITNLERDFQTAMVNLGGEHSARMAGDVAKAMPAAARGIWQSVFDRGQSAWRAEFEEMQAEGGAIGFFGLEDIEAKVNKIQQRLEGTDTVMGKTLHSIRTVRDLVLDANLSVENAARVAAYKVAKDKFRADGFSDKQAKMKAASIAKNLTVNFNRKGELAPIMNSAYLFYNASIQGSFRIFSALQHKRVQKIVGAVAAQGFALAIYNAAFGGDDEDGVSNWEKIPDYTKQTNMIFMHPDGSGNYSKIRLPYGYNVFHYAGQAIHDLMYGKRTTVMGQAMNLGTAVLNAYNPIQGADFLDTIMPTALKPVEQSVRNVNFMGANIMPEYPFDNYDRPDSEKAFKSTDPVLKQLMKDLNELTGGDATHKGLIDVSPETVKHYFNWITGGAGMTVGRTIGTTADVVTNLAAGETVTEGIEAKNVPLLRTVGGKRGKFYDTDYFYQAVKEVNATKAMADKLKGTPEYKAYRADHRSELALSLKLSKYKRRIKKLKEKRNAAYDRNDRETGKQYSEKIRSEMMKFSREFDEVMGI